jgi:hypothetical protein
LLSNCTCAPDGATSASPKFVPGTLTHSCTVDVTSNVTYCPAPATCAVCTVVAPIAGSVAYVTPISLHAPPTGCTAIVPGTSARLQ